MHGQWRHWLVWPVAAVVYRQVFLPLGRLLGLDFATLVTNLAWDWDLVSPKAWYANLDWIPWGRWLLAWGAAPLVLLFTAAVIFRLTEQFGLGSNPLANTSRAKKRILSLVAILPFLGFCMPFSLALSVWIEVEAFWWIQWYQNIEPAMFWIRTFVPFIILPGLILLGFFMLRFSLTKLPAETAERQGSRWALRALMIAVSTLMLLPCGLALAAGLAHASRVAAVPGRAVFEAECGKCHNLYLTFYYIKTPVEWQRTMNTQVEIERVNLSKGEQEDVTRFICGMRSFSDEWTFRTRCQRCHFTSYQQWEDRPAAEWWAITERLARWSPYYYRADVRDQVSKHLSRTRSHEASTLGLGADKYSLFQQVYRACGRCHSLSLEADRYRQADDAAVAALFARMNRKVAQPLPPVEAATLAAAYRDLISDGRRFDHLFPHDRPVNGGGLPW